MTMEQPQTKSDTPQLTAIAATILTGLLASGDYTDGPENFRPFGDNPQSQPPRSRYRPEVLADAVGLTIQLAEAMNKLTLKAAPTAPPAS